MPSTSHASVERGAEEADGPTPESEIDDAETVRKDQPGDSRPRIVTSTSVGRSMKRQKTEMAELLARMVEDNRKRDREADAKVTIHIIPSYFQSFCVFTCPTVPLHCSPL